MEFSKDLALDPEGCLYLCLQPSPSTVAKAPSTESWDDFAALLEKSEARALFFLEDSSDLKRRSGSFRFWSDFTANFLQVLCTTADEERIPRAFELSKYCRQFAEIPPILGYEFLTLERLGEKWLRFAEFVEADLPTTALGLREYIAAKFPRWAEVGKIHFHLAENSASQDFPFAFLATYSIRQNHRTRVQHLPLGRAIQGLIDSGDNGGIQILLSPLAKAAEKSEFVERLFQTKEVFKPLPLTADRTYEFLESIPALEISGIIVKVPKLWAGGQPPRAKAQVAVRGPEAKSFVGFNGLLKFSTSISIDGVKISESDAAEILASRSKLLFFRGRWIEVDREKLGGILDRFAKAQRVAGDTISFAEALRLLSGSYGAAGAAPVTGKGDADWLEIVGDQALEDIIKQLKDPESLGAAADAAILKENLKTVLRPYQLHGVQWARFISLLGLGGCLADDMGLGKTIQILALLLLEKTKPSSEDQRHHLIIAPASLLGNWKQEAAKFAPSLRLIIAHSSGDVATSSLKSGSIPLDQIDVVVTTYQMISRLPWLREKSWNCIVVDEAQAIKNGDTAVAKSIKSLTARCRFALTGTPVENRLTDLWSIFDFICPGILGNQIEFQRFSDQLQSEDRQAKFSQFRALIAPFILRRKKTDRTIIADLPDKVEKKVYCLLAPAQVSLYQAEVENLAKDLKSMDKDDKKRKGLILSYLTKFKQICNHPSQYLGNQTYDVAESGKFQRIREVLRSVSENLEKALIFTQYRELTDILAGLIERDFGSRPLVLHGGTAVKNRPGLVAQFQSPHGPKYFVLSLKAAGTGLNLTAASHVIHFDRWWNPAVEDQATDRAFRIGQKKNVIVHKFIVRGSIEERIDDMIESKKSLAMEVLGEKNELKFMDLGDEEILRMVQLDLNTAVD
jgi:non-specific serine/threonine protein kinase